MSDRFASKNSKKFDLKTSLGNGLVSIFLMTAVIVLVVAFVSISTSIADEHGAEQDAESSVIARASLAFCEDSTVEVGTAELVERWSEEGVKLVDVYIRVTGLADEAGLHAVHIHETGSCDPCSAAGGHFDPGPHGHSHPDGNHPFHSGDLVNIRVDESGDGELRTTTSRITLSPGPLSIFDEDGASLIIHVDPDTYCPGGEEAGCAGGARLACGIFELQEDS
ncbi:MAG: superoxide dismutase family protein [Gammaproteobacteria bacterium]|nr:superoxide dismutase family protein [Gammaproteobacteria bacterium]MYF37428.1 superoxide dismutase family protein [Gammaproteobacteria bacterium]